MINNQQKDNIIIYYIKQLEENVNIQQFIKDIQQSDVLSFIFIIAMLLYLFLCIEKLSKHYLSISFDFLIEEFCINKSIAAMTLVTYANGAPDIFDSIGSNQSNDSLVITIGALLGAFIFCLTIVLGNVIKKSKKKKLKLNKIEIQKELFTYLLGIIILVVLNYFKGLGKFYYVFFIIYFSYFSISMYFVKKLQIRSRKSSNPDFKQNIVNLYFHRQNTIDNRMNIINEDNIQLLQKQKSFKKDKMSFSQFFKQFLFGDSYFIIDLIIIPFRIIIFLTIPSIVFEIDHEEVPEIIYILNDTISFGMSIFLFQYYFFSFNIKIMIIISLLCLTFGILSYINDSYNKYIKWSIIIGSMLGSIFWMKLLCDFVLKLIIFLSNKYNINKIILSSLLIALGNTVPDYFNNGALSQIGQSTIAVLSCFTGQVFNFLLGIAMNLLYNKNIENIFKHDIIYYLISFCFFLIFVHFFLLTTNNFTYQKSHSFYLFLLYLIFLFGILFYLNQFIMNYKEIKQIGSGAYGKIYLIEDLQDLQQYALKKMLIDKFYGIDFTTIREIKILKEIDHPNIIKLKKIFIEKDQLCLQMDFYDQDLSQLIHQKQFQLNLLQRKSILFQILNGIFFLHKQFLMHRDLKPQNILINKKGELVLIDFGLTRLIQQPKKELSRGVVTRWYRSPELLYGSKNYGQSIDIWSVGCIFAEIFLKRPLFQGQSDIDQLSKIFGILGTPDKNWKEAQSLPNFLKFQNRLKLPLNKLMTNADQNEIELINQMLQLNPKKRCSAKKLLGHEYFKDFDIEEGKVSLLNIL